MRSIQEVVKRIDARLALIEARQRERPDWLTRLMLEETSVAGTAEHVSPTHADHRDADRNPALSG